MRRAVLVLSLLALSCSNDGAAGARRSRCARSARSETRATATIAVTSPAFAAGAAIPLRHSALMATASRRR